MKSSVHPGVPSSQHIYVQQPTSLDLFSAITAEEQRTVSTRRVLIVTTETENYSGGGGERSVWSGVLWTTGPGSGLSL